MDRVCLIAAHLSFADLNTSNLNENQFDSKNHQRRRKISTTTECITIIIQSSIIRLNNKQNLREEWVIFDKAV